MKPDGQDTVPVAVEVLDAQGRIVPTADNLVKFTITGPAIISGVGNGNPSSHEPDKAEQRQAFNGLCMALVRAGYKEGKVVLKAEAVGLKGSEVELSVGI